MRLLTCIVVLLGCTWRADAVMANVNVGQLDSLIAGHPLVLVEFTNFSGYTQHMIDLERDPSFSGVVFGHSNALVSTDLATRYGITGTPVYKLFKGNKIYHSAGDLEDLKKFISSHLQESPKRLGSQSELDQFVGSHEVSVVGFVKGNDKVLYERIADEHREEFTFAIADFESTTYPAPKIIVIHAYNGAVVATEVYSGEMFEGPLHKWLQSTAIPYFTSVTTPKEFINYAMLEDPVAFLISNSNQDDHSEYIEKFRMLAPQVRSSGYVVHIDPAHLSKEVGGMLRSVAGSLSGAEKTNPHGLLLVRKEGTTALHKVGSKISHAELRDKLSQKSSK